MKLVKTLFEFLSKLKTQAQSPIKIKIQSKYILELDNVDMAEVAYCLALFKLNSG